MNSRLMHELHRLYNEQSSKPLLGNDYLVHCNEADATLVHVLIKPPHDSVYRHKFIRLDIQVGSDYPHSPPTVTFINHDNSRIHPNMYEDGKCCATILNTWGNDKYEKWTSSMGVETIILAFTSFLDNNPYTYEPGGTDDHTYTTFVQFQSWYTCFLKYFEHETIEPFYEYMEAYLDENIDDIRDQLEFSMLLCPRDYYYTRCFEIDFYIIDYQNVLTRVMDYYTYYEYKKRHRHQVNDGSELSQIQFLDKDFDCSICYDTHPSTKQVTLHCQHAFHQDCLDEHVQKNGDLCPMCRADIVTDVEWMINPYTKRRIKVGGRTYLFLEENGML
jgi:ubiquitin-protein ligase